MRWKVTKKIKMNESHFRKTCYKACIPMKEFKHRAWVEWEMPDKTERGVQKFRYSTFRCFFDTKGYDSKNQQILFSCYRDFERANDTKYRMITHGRDNLNECTTFEITEFISQGDFVRMCKNKDKMTLTCRDIEHYKDLQIKEDERLRREAIRAKIQRIGKEEFEE